MCACYGFKCKPAQDSYKPKFTNSTVTGKTLNVQSGCYKMYKPLVFKITMWYKYLMSIRWQNIALHFYAPFGVSLWVSCWIIDLAFQDAPRDGIFHGSSLPSKFVTVILEFYGSVSCTFDGKIKLSWNWLDAFYSHLIYNLTATKS